MIEQEQIDRIEAHCKLKNPDSFLILQRLPGFIDMTPHLSEIKTKEELLELEWIIHHVDATLRTQEKIFLQFSQTSIENTAWGSTNNLMAEFDNGYGWTCMGAAYPNLPEDWFPEWKAKILPED